MILKAKHHPLIYPFFKGYALWKIRINFHKVKIIGDLAEKDLPVLIISNHLSWWDGFWVMYLNLKIFHRKFWFMMLEEQLKKHMFFNYTGGFSIKKGSRSIIETLDYTVGLLKNRENLVLIFPQGEIQSIQTRNIRFEKGIDHIISKVKGQAQIIFLVSMVEYFSNSKPTLYMHVSEFTGSDTGIIDTEKAYRMFHEKVIAEYADKKEPE